MAEIKNLTDAELIEAVAREVMGYGNHWYLIKSDPPVMRTQLIGEPELRWFRPFTDLNDLFMVLEKLENWQIDKWHGGCTVRIWIGGRNPIEITGADLQRAVLEACLTAERGKG